MEESIHCLTIKIRQHKKGMNTNKINAAMCSPGDEQITQKSEHTCFAHAAVCALAAAHGKQQEQAVQSHKVVCVTVM